MKQVKIEIDEKAFLFYQRVASVFDCSAEKVIADYLSGLSDILVRHLIQKENENE